MKNGFVKVACATPKVRVADCKYNTNEITRLAKSISDEGASLIVFPELCITGYSCGDLFLNGTLVTGALDSLFDFLDDSADLDAAVVVGLPFSFGGKLYNCAAVCKSGELLALVPKKNIPMYANLYEGRYFSSAPEEGEYIVIGDSEVYFGNDVIFSSDDLDGFSFGVEICEDLFAPSSPSADLASAGAYIICNPSASDEAVGRPEQRRSAVTVQSSKCICAYAYTSCGYGESTTDGVSGGHRMIAECGRLIAESEPFALSDKCYTVTDIDLDKIAHDRAKVNTFSSTPSKDIEVIPFNHEIKDIKLTRSINAYPFVPSDESEKTARAEYILSMQAYALARRMEAAYAKTAVIGISGGLDSTLALIVACKAIDLLSRPRTDIIGVTMPCFGTTKRTRGNAEKLCEQLNVSFRTVNISRSVRSHFKDIGHDENDHSVVYENSQARERTQVIMDISNATGGIVVGTGDLSELALGWATYNGDHMSMYGVNASIPKTLVRCLVGHYASVMESEGKTLLASVLRDILATPVSPELLPASADGSIAQITEDLVGPYELHDFFIYNFVRHGYSPRKLLFLAENAFAGVYTRETILKWLKVFVRRFFTQQFKRSCVPDGPKVGSVALSPRGDWRMPSDASYALWMSELEEL